MSLPHWWDCKKCLIKRKYRVTLVVVDQGLVDYDFGHSIVLGRWEFGRIGWATGQNGGPSKNQHNQRGHPYMMSALRGRGVSPKEDVVREAA